MKLTRHNGRSGKHGTYNPKHNDRTFDVSNSEHIDEERAKHNVYWDCFNGYRTFAEKQVQSELADTFEEVEELFYSAKYGAYPLLFLLPKMILTMCCVWAAIQTARESVWLLPLKSKKPPLRLPRY